MPRTINHSLHQHNLKSVHSEIRGTIIGSVLNLRAPTALGLNQSILQLNDFYLVLMLTVAANKLMKQSFLSDTTLDVNAC